MAQVQLRKDFMFNLNVHINHHFQVATSSRIHPVSADMPSMSENNKP